MFTGIIEEVGRITGLETEQDNLHMTVSAPMSGELKVDQSVAHNGVCLTVVELNEGAYRVTAIKETLQRTNLGELKVGSLVNLERCMVAGARLDGHIVQGHVDLVAKVTEVKEEGGSWTYRFQYDGASGHLTVEKGSICINGVSLTVVESGDDHFSVAIIPYTYEHTNFKDLQPGDPVNLEFDIIGKYVERYLARTR